MDEVADALDSAALEGGLTAGSCAHARATRMTTRCEPFAATPSGPTSRPAKPGRHQHLSSNRVPGLAGRFRDGVCQRARVGTISVDDHGKHGFSTVLKIDGAECPSEVQRRSSLSGGRRAAVRGAEVSGLVLCLFVVLFACLVITRHLRWHRSVHVGTATSEPPGACSLRWLVVEVSRLQGLALVRPESQCAAFGALGWVCRPCTIINTRRMATIHK